MDIEGIGIDDETFDPWDSGQADDTFRLGDAMKDIREKTHELAFPIIKKLVSGQMDREEAFIQLKQILVDNFSSTEPIVEDDEIDASPMSIFLGELAPLLLRNGISGEDTEYLIKRLSNLEDIRDKVEKVVEKH